MSMEIGRTGFFQASAAVKNGQTAKPAGQKAVEAASRTDRVEISDKGREAVQDMRDYVGYLREKFSYMNTGKTLVSGFTVTVTVSEAFLEKCMHDPEKAKYLEENLAAVPECVNKAAAGCCGTLTDLRYAIDDGGNISVMISGTNEAKENHEPEEEESKSLWERVAFNAEKRARQLASAKTPEQVRQIMALLSEDLTDCKAGLERGACDEAEVAKVEAMIRQARSRMAQVAGNDAEEQPGLSAFELNSLM